MVDRDTVRLGVIASGELPERLAGQLAEDLPGALCERVSSDVVWQVPVISDRWPRTRVRVRHR